MRSSTDPSTFGDIWPQEKEHLVTRLLAREGLSQLIMFLTGFTGTGKEYTCDVFPTILLLCV